MTRRVLVTGSAGLIGRALQRELVAAGFEVTGLDLRARGHWYGDVRDRERVESAVHGCSGVVHLAAVSRVVAGERDPAGCWSTNVLGVSEVIDAVERRRDPPWLIFASSREVYGQATRLPVCEDATLAPVNVYGRSKLEGERLVAGLAGRGGRAAIVRLSNVYGSAADHPDRVIPAFVRAALAGEPLRVEGAGNTFDFTHLDDTARGLVAVAKALARGDVLPPLHLLTGRPTTLGELAATVVELAGTTATIPWREAPARTFDVGRFVGDPSRAASLLGWTARVALREGLARLVADCREVHGAPPAHNTGPRGAS
jgi:nucleoside-diphosphate-sugar epimerase